MRIHGFPIQGTSAEITRNPRALPEKEPAPTEPLTPESCRKSLADVLKITAEYREKMRRRIEACETAFGRRRCCNGEATDEVDTA